MRAPLSLVSRAMAAGILFLALGASLGTAQPKAEATPGAASQDESKGVLVLSVQAGSPAEKAGVVRGDILLEANGTPVNTTEALQGLVAARSPGDTVTLKLRHGEVEKNLSVPLGMQRGRAYLGIVPFDAGMLRGGGERMGGWSHPIGQGAYVVRIVPGGPAANAGLGQGMLRLAPPPPPASAPDDNPPTL